MAYEDLISQISAMKFGPVGKYSAKLDFEQRCEILALYRSGVGRTVLAEAYGLDRRTVTHIYNPNSVHYRNVRDMEKHLGTELFLKTFITENALARLRRVVKPDVEVVKDDKAPRAKRSATKYAGVHEVQTSSTSFAHRIIIGWCEATLDNDGPGWYYRDADGPDPDAWVHNGDESRMSSLACLNAVKDNLVDL